MTREEIVNSFEFHAAKSACQYNDRNAKQDNVTAYEEGAECGYNFAVEKACDWLWGVRLDYYAEHEEEFLEDFKKAMALD